MTVIIPVLAAMYLGGSFDLTRYQKGAADIYDLPNIKDKIQTIQRSMTKSQYKLIDSSSDARDFLDVSGELALRIKSNTVDVAGSGSYLKDTSSRDNFVELLVRVQHETVTETIPSSVAPSTEWMSKPRSQVGTHFVRSITYGGELIASVRLLANNRQEREKIKAAVSANLQFTGTLDLGAKGNFEKLRKDLKGSYREEISTTATITPNSPPQSIEQLMAMVNTYPEEVMKLNNGKGRPLRAELYPLNSFKVDYEEYLTNSAITGMLDSLEAKYDDLRIAQGEFLIWNENLPYDISEESTEKVEKYYNDLESALDEFNNAISQMDTSMTGSTHQFDRAFKLYGKDGDNIPERFQRMLWILKNEVTNTSLEWEKPQGHGSVYTRWGDNVCPGSDADILVKGTAFGALYSSFGGGDNPICSPDDEETIPQSSDRGLTLLEKITYYVDDEKLRTVKCAVCYVQRASSAVVFPSRSSCPTGWRLEYRGYLAAEAFARSGNKFFCMDLEVKGDEHGFDEEESAKLSAVWDGDNRVPCVVCTYF